MLAELVSFLLVVHFCLLPVFEVLSLVAWLVEVSVALGIEHLSAWASVQVSFGRQAAL